MADYEPLVNQFNPVKFDAKAWVKVAKDAGMKYIVITSKHHDGFSMFDTKLTDYNVVKATPWHHDPMKDLAAACKEAGIKFCFYYSIMDWHEEGPLPAGQDYNNKPPKDLPKYTEYMKGELKELVTQYGPLGDLVRRPVDSAVDARDGAKPGDVRGLQPDIIVNNRVGKGGFGDGDYETPEQHIPAGDKGRLWETCMTLTTVGASAKDQNWKSAQRLTQNLSTFQQGRQLPPERRPDGRGPDSAKRGAARGGGAWLKKNGEAIYGTQASPFRHLGWGRCTVKPGVLYLHVFDWPTDGTLVVGGLKSAGKGRICWRMLRIRRWR